MINGGLNINISGVTDIYEVNSFNLNETLDGNISEGSFTLICRSDMTIDIYEFNISISDDSGYSIEFPAYAYKLSYDESLLKVNFICSYPDFTKTNLVRSYSSVLDAVNSNWNGILEYNQGSDIKCEIHQRSETGYQLVSKLIKGLRYKSLSGFRCDRIVVRELNDDIDLDIKDETFSIRSMDLTFSKSKVRDLVTNIDELGVSSSITYSRSFKQVRSDYSELIKNYFVNNSLIKILGSYRTQIRYTKSIPEVNIGNIVNFKLKDISTNRFIVFSKHISWDGVNGIITDLDLIGYDW